MNAAIKLLLTGAVFLGFAATARAEKTAAVEGSFMVGYRLVLAADGSIETLILQDDIVSAELAGNLEKQIRSWTYSPGNINGKPARTETNLLLTVEATPNVDGNYSLRIVNADTGASAAKGGMTPPKYPAQQMRLGHEAVLLLLVSYDASGNVTKVERPGEKIRGFAPFEKASFEAAKKWRFEPEKIDGIGVPGQAIVPVKYCIHPYDCASLLKGSKEKEKLAREVVKQTVPVGSLVAIHRELSTK